MTSDQDNTDGKAKRKTVFDLWDAVVEFSHGWKPERSRNSTKGAAWEPTDADENALRDVVIALAGALDGSQPMTDLRRMHDALTRAERGERERRARVVSDVNWALWVWKRTAKHEWRRKQVADELVEMLSEEHPRFATLRRADVLAAFADRKGKAGAVHVAGGLGAKCRAFGDANATKARDAYQKAVGANRRRKP